MENQKDQLYNYLQLLKGDIADYDSILEASQNIEHVLIGESTHGTHEFYSIRAEITKQLILEKKFSAIAIEGDWPNTYRVNQYVRGDKTIKTAVDALDGFKRFPTWMWRNEVIVEFINWLHEHNSNLPPKDRVGFYGLDLYSLNASTKIIIKYLEKIDINAAEKARQRYACFDSFREELQNYGYATMLGLTKSCENEVIAQLVEFNQSAYSNTKDNNLTEDDFFDIKQNTRLVQNAESYYRAMFNHKSSWNIRDMHMIETLDQLVQYLSEKLQKPAKIITWAHNSHIGDARATEVRIRGQLNIGQLAREKYGNKALLIGFLTYFGFVTAASKWDEKVECKKIRPALPYSYEDFFHLLNSPNFLINFRANEQVKKLIPKEFLERAIGVIYLPEAERDSHYFYANLAKQFDIVIYLDKTSAVRPLELAAIWHKGEVCETFPSGL